MDPKPLKAGDQCPRCDVPFMAARVPSDAQYAKAFDREHAPGLPEGMDTASPDQRAELGALHRCPICGYQARFAAEAAPAAAAHGN